MLKKDTVEPSLLHIFARHLKSEENVFEIYFNGDTKWDKELDCFVTTFGNDELRWYWIDESKKVLMVVTCFQID